jgi:anti-sigma factor RsiW
MSHIDEGVLHAYLDGEAEALIGPDGRPADREGIERHLAECAECRSHLADARQLRDRAASILGASGPAAVSPPPFEDVVARSRSRGRRVLQLNRLTALGWAAVVVLAVGVGWIARETVGFRESQTVPAVGPETAPVDLAQAPERPEPEPTIAAAPAEQEARGAATGEAGGERRDAPAVAKSEPQPPGRAERAITEDATRLAEADEAAAAPPEARAIPQAAAPEMEVAAVPADARVAQQHDSAERFADVDAAEDAVEALNRAREAAEWTTAGKQAAEDHLGGPLLTVPDLPVVAVRIGAVDGEPAARVLQRLPSGESLELLQVRASEGARGAVAYRRDLEQADSAAPAGAMASVSQSMVVRRGYVITGWAGIPADSLRALLERIQE